MDGTNRLDWESIKFGLLSTLKTGNMAIDTLICCVVPILVSIALSQSIHLTKWWNESAWPCISRLLFGDKDANKGPVFMRIINHKSQLGAYHSGVQTDKTKQLMTAISLYVKTLNIKFPSADVSLVDIDEEGAHRNYLYGIQPDIKKDPFANHEMLWQPINGLWIKVSEHVEFQRQEEIVDNGHGGDKHGQGGGDGSGGNNRATNNKVTFSFRSYAADGDRQIDDFLITAFDWYKKQISLRKDNTRYYYSYVAKDSLDQGSPSTHYKRFALSDEKDFSAVFFPHKEDLLQLLDTFKSKTGRYAIKGSAHKLGLLLHGPPGTGKTSFIKALANHFHRHILSIPLSRISTNEELVDMLFDLNLRVAGSDYPIQLMYNQVIFIFEDIDAASDVVNKRVKPTAQANRTTTVKITTKEHVVRKILDLDGSGSTDSLKLDGSRTSGLSRSGGGQSASDQNLADTAGSGPAEESDATLVKIVEKEVSRGYGEEKYGGDEYLMSSLNSWDEIENDEELDLSAPRSVAAMKKKFNSSKYFERKDKLNLAGLLEVLDGVVDTPGRLIVMTTNHPERLDAALVRPGRIDKKIKLDYLASKECIEMTEHFLGPLSSIDRGALTAVIKSQGPSRVISPAVLEQACAEHPTPASLIPALARFVRSEQGL